MYVNITGSSNNKDIYIYQSYRKENGKTSSRIFKKLGKYNELLERFDNDKEKLMAWAKEEARKETEAYNNKAIPIPLKLSQKAFITKDEERCFNVGYLFLQQLCTDLRIDNICRKIKERHKFKYDFSAILTDLIYARILSPSSKLSSYTFCQKLLEPPKYSLQNVYRALSVMAKNPFLFRRSCIVIQILFTPEIQKYCITIVQITTSKSRKKMETNVMEKAKKIDQTLLLQWAYLWMLTVYLLLLIFFLATKTSRLP